MGNQSSCTAVHRHESIRFNARTLDVNPFMYSRMISSEMSGFFKNCVA